MRGGAATGRRSGGFTLIELLVVMAIVALLVSIASPRYFRSVEHAKEAALRSSLNVMRSAIDQFAADRDRYPDSLEQLVSAKYLRSIPIDPLTNSGTTWVTVDAPADAVRQGLVADVRSGMTGSASDGRLFADW